MGKKDKKSKRNTDEVDKILDKLEKQAKMSKQQRKRYKSILARFEKEDQERLKNRKSGSNKSKKSTTKQPIPPQNCSNDTPESSSQSYKKPVRSEEEKKQWVYTKSQFRRAMRNKDVKVFQVCQV